MQLICLQGLRLPPPVQAGAASAAPAAPFLTSVTKVELTGSPEIWVGSGSLSCVAKGWRHKAQPGSGSESWSEPRAQSTEDGELVCSDKRMHKILETLKPPVLSAADTLKPPVLSESPPSPAELCQGSPGRHGLCQPDAPCPPTAICSVPLAAQGGEGELPTSLGGAQ